VGWDEEKVVERYDLLCEAGLAGRKRRLAGAQIWRSSLGQQARILASAIAEVRRAIKSRPVISTDAELSRSTSCRRPSKRCWSHSQAEFPPAGGGRGPGRADRDTGSVPADAGAALRFRRNVLLEKSTPGCA